MSDIDTSIVLATCSRAHLLRGALASLLSEAKAWEKPVEFVIVDDGSTDDTPAVLAKFQGSAGIPVTIVMGECRGIAAARNLAVQHARGTWLASFDDDQIALPGWLAGLHSLAESTGAVCIGGALALQLPPGHAIAALGPRVRRVLGEHLDGDIVKPNGMEPASNNVLLRRDIFLELGGYDITFTEGAEDADLFDRMAAAGHAWWFQPAAKALHLIQATRLETRSIAWTCLRLGASDARRFTRRGTGRLLRTAALRVLVTLLRDLPQLAIAGMRRDRRKQMDVLCSLWYTQGLLRALPAFLGSKPKQTAFLRSLDFRARNGERPDKTVLPTS